MVFLNIFLYQLPKIVIIVNTLFAVYFTRDTHRAGENYNLVMWEEIFSCKSCVDITFHVFHFAWVNNFLICDCKEVTGYITKKEIMKNYLDYLTHGVLKENGAAFETQETANFSIELSDNLPVTFDFHHVN